MDGFDAELGWRVPVTAPDSGLKLRLYGGGNTGNVYFTDGTPCP